MVLPTPEPGGRAADKEEKERKKGAHKMKKGCTQKRVYARRTFGMEKRAFAFIFPCRNQRKKAHESLVKPCIDVVNRGSEMLGIVGVRVNRNDCI